mgnify:FL=1
MLTDERELDVNLRVTYDLHIQCLHVSGITVPLFDSKPKSRGQL